MGGHGADFTVAVVVADVALVLVAGLLLAPPMARLRQPRVIAEIVAGIALGPSVLGLLPGNLPEHLVPPAARPHLSAVAEAGLLLFMFLVGWELDLRPVRGRRRTIVAVAVSSLAVPFALGAAAAALLYARHATVAGHHVDRTAFLLFVGAATAVTAFPVLARILVEHRLQATLVGTLALASAAVADLFAWSMLVVVTAVVAANGPAGFLRLVCLLAGYLVLLAALVRPILRRLTARLTAAGGGEQVLVVVAAGAFLSGWVTSWMGLDAIFGAFAFGLVMPRQPRDVLMVQLRQPLERISQLLLPVFFVSAGLAVDVRGLGVAGLADLAVIMVAACVGKIAGAAVSARLTGLSWPQARHIGLLMNTRGLTELVVLNVGRSLGILDGSMFTLMVLMAVATTMMAGPLLPRPAASAGSAIEAADRPGQTAEVVPERAR
jgi:Kef-type K+ transport system membrane component KefB